LGEEWFTKEETEQIFSAFCLPYLSPDRDVLEIGCGGGKYSIKAAPRCKKLFCFDVSEEMLRRTREVAKGIGNIQYVKGNGLDLSHFGDRMFDFVFSFDVFVHIDLEDMYCYFREVKRVLKDGGCFAVHVADLMSEIGWRQFVKEVDQNRGNQKLFCRLRYLSFEIVKRLATELEYKIVKTNYRGGLHRWLIHIASLLGYKVIKVNYGDNKRFIAERDIIVVLQK
jgi:ubiquinone/menaquinone biosynthesis C-methylase UbiE